MDSACEDSSQTHMLTAAEVFRQLAARHAEYKRQAMTISCQPHLTPEEEIEASRLKKLKLQVKDQMAELVHRTRQEPA